ncbi:MAG: tetratricopeptide repeat protein, partial [Bacteroidota bacterium]
SIEFPLQLYARIIRSKVYNSTNRAEMAEQDLKDICANHKTFGAAFRQLGMFYINKGEKDMGEVYQERANDLRVFNFATDTLMDRLSLISRSEAYVLKQIDNAMQGNDGKWSYELIKQAHENMPNSKYVLSKAIRQYSSIGMGKQALPLLDEHFEYFKEDYDEMLQIGIKLSGAGYRKEAAKYFEQAWSLEDQSPEQKATLAGMFLENAGMANRAIELMSTVAEANPDNETVLGDAVFLMLQTNQTDKAFQYFNSLKKQSPDNANIKIFQGIQAEKNGKIKEAISFFRAAYEDKPKNKFLKSHLSELYVQEQLWSPALEFFRSALEVDPNDSELQMYIGLLLVTCPDENLLNLKEGKEYSERAFYNSRYNINNRISAGRTLAIAHYQLEDRKNALFYINKTIQIAEQASVSESYIQELRNLAQRFS